MPILPEIHLPRLTGQMLADVVLHKGVSAGSLDGWGFSLSYMLIILSVSRVTLICFCHAARFTTGYVRLVGQEPAPSKCVLLSTSRDVRKDWVLSCEGDQWSVKFDVRDLGGHLDTTFSWWSSTLAARVRLVISRLVLIFVLPLDFHGRVRVVRSMYLPAALHGLEASLLASDSLRKLRSAVRGDGLVSSAAFC